MVERLFEERKVAGSSPAYKPKNAKVGVGEPGKSPNTSQSRLNEVHVRLARLHMIDASRRTVGVAPFHCPVRVDGR